jgi:DnaK suppressor protein
MQDGRYALPTTVRIELPNGYKPTAKEEYMSPRQLEYFRRKLGKWREELVEESRQTIESLRDEVRDVGDEAERATRETENSLELRTRDRYRKLISKIDKALKRIEEGRYGLLRGDRRGNRTRSSRSASDRDAQPRRAGSAGSTDKKQMGD